MLILCVYDDTHVPPAPVGDIKNPVGAVIVSGDEVIADPFIVNDMVDELVPTVTLPKASRLLLVDTIGTVAAG